MASVPSRSRPWSRRPGAEGYGEKGSSTRRTAWASSIATAPVQSRTVHQNTNQTDDLEHGVVGLCTYRPQLHHPTSSLTMSPSLPSLRLALSTPCHHSSTILLVSPRSAQLGVTSLVLPIPRQLPHLSSLPPSPLTPPALPDARFRNRSFWATRRRARARCSYG